MSGCLDVWASGEEKGPDARTAATVPSTGFDKAPQLVAPGSSRSCSCSSFPACLVAAPWLVGAVWSSGQARLRG